VTETTLSQPADPAQPPAAAPDATAAPEPPQRPRRQWELDALRVLAIAGVLAIHIIGQLVSNAHLHGTKRWWAAVTIDLGAVWVVPVFVMISGALVLAPRAHAAGPGAFYRKRFVRILPALVVWHLVYLFGVRVGLRGEKLSLPWVTTMLIDAKVYTALYFLWLIAGLYIVAPVLAAFLRGGGQRRAVGMAAVALSFSVVAFSVAGLATLVGTPRTIYLGALTQWWPYVGYFLAGWALHRVVLSVKGIVAAAGIAVVMLAEIVVQYGHAPHYRTLQLLLPVSYLGLTAAVASICIFLVAVGIGARITPPARVSGALKVLSDASFGVFLVHLAIFEVIRQSVPAVFQAASIWVLLAAYATVLVTAFAVSIGASKVPYLRTVF
jgi:surface polysaccharide O-acyltransferase-like enzyme